MRSKLRAFLSGTAERYRSVFPTMVLLGLGFAGLRAWELRRVATTFLRSAAVPRLFLAQMCFVACVALLAACFDGTRRRWARWPLLALMILLFVVFNVETVALRYYKQSFGLGELWALRGEWREALPFVGVWQLVMLAVILAVPFVRVPLRRFRPVYGVAIAALLYIVGIATRASFPAETLQDYAFTPAALFRSTADATSFEGYSDAEVAAAMEKLGRLAPVQLPPGKPDILLVVVESMSASFSGRLSGGRGLLPRFDERTKRGVLFTNYLANYSLTEGGLISVLSGVPPIPYPGSPIFDLSGAFAVPRSVPHTLNSLGYHTEFIINTVPSFRKKGLYLNTIGLDRVTTMHDVPEFRNGERFTFNSTSDEVLFDYVLSRLKATNKIGRPRFFGKLTISSHPPYVDPLKRANTRENVWDFVDMQLARLIDELTKSGFFKRGILVVTGDHREPGNTDPPLPGRPRAWSGTHSVLFIMGKGVPQRVDERLFTQSEIFTRLQDAIQNPDTNLVDYVTIVSNHQRSSPSFTLHFLFRDPSIARATLVVRGLEMKWKEKPPPEPVAAKLLAQVAAQRALFQKVRTDAAATPPDWYAPLSPGAFEEPLRVRLFSEVRKREWRSLGGGRRVMVGGSRVPAFLPPMGELHAQPSLVAVYDGHIDVPRDGEYMFEVELEGSVILSIDQQALAQRPSGPSSRVKRYTANLRKGRHRFDLHCHIDRARALKTLRLSWLTPGANDYGPIPPQAFGK